MHATPRAKLIRDASALAREHTERAIETIAHVMDDWTAEDRDRIAAANALLDRAHGKPVNAVIQVPLNRQIAQQLAAMSDEDLESQLLAQPLPRLAAIEADTAGQSPRRLGHSRPHPTRAAEAVIDADVDEEPDPLTL